jgi:hypothetical protein
MSVMFGDLICNTTPQSMIDNWGRDLPRGLNRAGVAAIPPPLAVRPELTDEDVAWLNEQLALTSRPPVQYARVLPAAPLPPSGARLATDTSWIAMTAVRG